MTPLRLNQQDFIESRDIISGRLSKNLSNHPAKFTNILTKAIVTAKSATEFATAINHKHSLAMRKAHDFYGWMAKNGKLGGCKGSIYRSQNFMNLPIKMRSGKKIHAETEFGVHIEHTIPIKQIVASLWAEQAAMLSHRDEEFISKLMFEKFLNLSVCTALTRKEQQTCINPAYHDSHPDFKVSAKSSRNIALEEIRPFKRYNFNGDLKIFEVVNDTRIDPNTWSLRNHAELLENVNIYRWDFISLRNVI